MQQLFSSICDIIFTLEDNSQIRCRTTLDPKLLQEQGYNSNIDGFIDLSSGRLIPEDLFENSFIICSESENPLSDLDKMFNLGGKIHWNIAH